ncbi:MAG: hypothetical protein IPG45_32640 [Deltaproteobacteria bacterium]|nr:hypothetical protein [Deltaproteobacteria bacterium]
MKRGGPSPRSTIIAAIAMALIAGCSPCPKPARVCAPEFDEDAPCCLQVVCGACQVSSGPVASCDDGEWRCRNGYEVEDRCTMTSTTPAVACNVPPG